MPYFANIDRKKDRHPDRELPGLVEVLPTPDELKPFGVAVSQGPNRAGSLLWRLNIDGKWVEGRFVLISREFVPAK